MNIMRLILLVLFSSTISYGQFHQEKPLSQADAAFIGEAAGDESGWMRPAGDVNGDGFDDIFVSSFANDEGGINAGQSYLFLGSDTLTWTVNQNVAQADASFIGESAGDAAGTNACTVGDVNGDGNNDFIITAWENDDGGANAGKGYLFLGSDTMTLALDQSVSQAHATFVGESAGDKINLTGHPGDVNGDGLDDLLFRSGGNDEGGTDAGQVYLILGRAQADWGVNFSLASADASFIGEAALDQLGYSTVSIIGDVNGDGYDEMLMSAPFNDQGGNACGKTYLILGKQAADWGMDFNISGADAAFIGEAVDDGAGISCNKAGDVNGDGLMDFIIGSDWNSDASYRAGQTYLILGKSEADWGSAFSLSQADASFIGVQPNSSTGRMINYVGDVNGDEFDDFMITAWKYNNNQVKIYLILGKSEADWGMDYDLSLSEISFLGEGYDEWAGYPIAPAGDVNGDGLDDILIGATHNDDGGTDAGKGYLILGDLTVISVSIDDEAKNYPVQVTLYQNYPNPFNPITTIQYELPLRSEVEITIFDLLGKKVSTLVSESQDAGYKSIQWNATEVSSGMYFYQIKAGDFVQIRKMVLLK